MLGGVTAAITGITGAIILLGNRGADVNDVTQTFEHFSGSVETADATLKNMRDGVLGTVDDFDLMKDASKLLAADVKLSSEQFGTLTKAAFVLQNQGLGPTKDMLDLVSQALLTGRTRSLEMKIGKIDLAKAEKDYAASLGVEKLTRMQKVEADRIGILDALNKKVKEAGVQHRDFGEQMEAAVVAVKNWGDELASAVAKSPQVMMAVDAIGDAIMKAFGGTGKTAIELIVGWINKFADAVRTYGPMIIQTMVDVVHKVKEIYDSIIKAWDTAPDWFKAIAKEATIAAVAVGGVAIAQKQLTGTDILTTTAALANIWSGFGGMAAKAATQIGGLVTAFRLAWAWGTFAGGGVTGGLSGLFSAIGTSIGLLLVPAAITASIAALAAAVYQFVGAFSAANKAMSGGTPFMTFLLRQDKDNFVRRLIPGLSTQNMPTAPGAPSAASRFQPPALGGVNITEGAVTQARQVKILTEADEEYTKKLEAMQQKYAEASLEGRLFTDTFNSLSTAQKANYDVQQMIIPQLDKMIESHKALTPEMQRVYSASTALEQSYLNQEDSILQLSGLTQESVDRAKEQGITEAQLAASYGVSTKALGLYLSEKKKQQGIDQALASFEAALVNDQAAAAARKEAIALASNKKIGDASKQLNDMLQQQTLTTTDYEIQKAQEAEAVDIAAFNALGKESEDYNKTRRAITEQTINQILIKESQLVMQNAVNAKQMKDTWVKVIGDIPTLIQNAFTGGGGLGGAFKAIISDAGSAIGSAIFGSSGFINKIGGPLVDGIGKLFGKGVGGALAVALPGIGEALGSLIGPAIQGLGKLLGIGPTAYEKRMKAAADETKTLQTNLIKAHGSMQMLIVDADLVGINIKEAFKWKDPAAFKDIVDQVEAKTQLLNSAMEEYGFTWQDLGEKGRAAKLGELFDDLFAKTEILKGAGIDYNTILERQAGDYSSLVQKAISSNTEISEAMRPVLQDLVDQGKLLDANGDAYKNLDDVHWAKTLTQGFDEVTSAIHELTDALLNGVGGAMDTISHKKLVINREFVDTGGSSTDEPQYHAAGGRVLAWRPRGTDTVPAMLTPGETVIPAGKSEQPVIINATIKMPNNEVLAKQVVKTFVRGGL